MDWYRFSKALPSNDRLVLVIDHSDYITVARWVSDDDLFLEQGGDIVNYPYCWAELPARPSAPHLDNKEGKQ